MDDDPTRLGTEIQMLATLVATATYAAGFNPPGGVWQDIHDATGHLPGDPIMRSTHYLRYAVFFYCNAVAFTLSLIIAVVTLFVTAYPEGSKLGRIINWYLGFLMAAATLAFTVAYGAGACRNKLTIVWYSVNVPIPLAAFILQVWHQHCWVGMTRRRRMSLMRRVEGSHKLKLMAPLSMFALTISYVAGLSTPGGFWDSAEGGHRPGDAILGDRLHGRPLKAFFMLNTMTFVASLYAVSITVSSSRIIIRLLDGALMYLLLGLLGAYIVGSSRGRVNWLPLYGEIFLCMSAYVAVHRLVITTADKVSRLAGEVWSRLAAGTVSRRLRQMCRCAAGSEDEEASAIAEDQRRQPDPAIPENNEEATTRQQLCCLVLFSASFGLFQDILQPVEQGQRRRNDVASATTEGQQKHRRRASLVQLMASLAVAITYQAGLYPPGGLWPANADGHTAGDPILLTTNARRYKGFHYCNSVSFVASLLAIFLAQKKFLHEHHALEAAMILDMLGLIGAYAIGSCRDQASTLYVAGIAGAGVVYVFVHVSYFTLGDTDDREAGAGAAGTEAGAAGTEGDNLQDQDDVVEKLGGRFLLFAVLVASITYQAGLTPPGGFLLEDDAKSGHHAGDPVLLYNYPRRYRAFFYCNSVSFMLSIVLILLLVNPNEYRPAIRSHAVTVCSAVSYVCLMGAFAAGSTQHLTGSYFIFVLAGLPSLSSLILLLLNCWKGPKKGDEPGPSGSELSRRLGLREGEARTTSEKSVYSYLVTLAILAASATYPAGLDPPGGSWQSSSDGHDAGNPVMHDSRRQRYLAFFVGNTTSFLASVMLIVMLVEMSGASGFWDIILANSGLVSLQCLGFLVAYAAGSSREWKTSAHIGTLVGAVLLFVAVHVSLSFCRKLAKDKQRGQGPDDGEQTAR